MDEKLRVNGNKSILHNSIKAKLGITDKKNQKVFYLEGGAFLTPQNDLEDFAATMRDVESVCRRQIKSKLLSNTAITSDFLMNFEVCSDRMKKGKRTYLSFQYHFKQKPNLNISVVTLKNDNEDFFISLLNDIENELNAYDISVSKKRN